MKEKFIYSVSRLSAYRASIIGGFRIFPTRKNNECEIRIFDLFGKQFGAWLCASEQEAVSHVKQCIKEIEEFEMENNHEHHRMIRMEPEP